jgi:ERCC4-type nuclease
MIQVDDRVGSVELIPILQNLMPCLCRSVSALFVLPPVTSTRLLCGDVSFEGVGPKDSPILIGIERKRLGDMLSSLRSGRYEGKQLPEMCDYYDASYLIIEGQYRCGVSGDLEKLITKAHPMGDTLGGKWWPVKLGDQVIRYTELDHLICKAQASGVRVRTAATEYETAAQVISLYTQSQKSWDKQVFTGAIHVPQDMATVGKASLVRRVAATLNGIGWERSGDVALKFATVKALVDAAPSEWETVRGIGKTLARRAFDQIRGEYKDKGEL